MSKQKGIIIDKYSTKPVEEWLHNFVEQYNELKPDSAAEYDQRRDKSTPPHKVLMQMHGLTSWVEFKKLAGVVRYWKGRPSYDTDNLVLKVKSHNNLLLKVMQQFNCYSIEEFLESGKLVKLG